MPRDLPVVLPLGLTLGRTRGSMVEQKCSLKRMMFMRMMMTTKTTRTTAGPHTNSFLGKIPTKSKRIYHLKQGEGAGGRYTCSFLFCFTIFSFRFPAHILVGLLFLFWQAEDYPFDILVLIFCCTSAILLNIQISWQPASSSLLSFVLSEW